MKGIDTANPTASQVRTAELLLKYHGMLIDRSEQQVTATINIQVNVDKDTQSVMDRGVVEMLQSNN